RTALEIATGHVELALDRGAVGTGDTSRCPIPPLLAPANPRHHVTPDANSGLALRRFQLCRPVRRDARTAEDPENLGSVVAVALQDRPRRDRGRSGGGPDHRLHAVESRTEIPMAQAKSEPEHGEERRSEHGYARKKTDAISDDRAALRGLDHALVLPLALREHRRTLEEAPDGLELNERKIVVVDRHDARGLPRAAPRDARRTRTRARSPAEPELRDQRGQLRARRDREADARRQCRGDAL